MEPKRKITLLLLLLLGSCMEVTTNEAATDELACGSQRTISEALGQLKPGDTLLVSGACTENVLIPEQVVADTRASSKCHRRRSGNGND